jgi:4-hydroxy-2-oxoheptanedioate aldolase
MKTRKSRLLSKLRAGEYPTTMKLNLSDPRVTEIAGLSGVDAVWMCNEHVPNDWIGLENQIRVSRGSYSDYIRPFEADATGIIVPHVSTAAEAKQIVEWVRFYPVGKRALDGGNADAMYCDLPIEEYIAHSNSERIVILQIESPEALENVEAIAAVPGFDGLLFGPGDFSHRIGKVGKLDDPQVVAARKRVAAAAVKNGKYAMTAGLIGPFADLVAEGYRIFNAGADVVGLGAFFKQRVAMLQDHIKTAPPAGKSSNPYA